MQCVKACVGGPPRQPSWGCSQLCRPLWGYQTVPTIHWQQSPAGGISDSFGSAHSCGNRRERVMIINHFFGDKRIYWIIQACEPSSHHLSMHFWQKLCAQGRMRSDFPSMQIQHSSSSVSCFTLHRHTNRERIRFYFFS